MKTNIVKKSIVVNNTKSVADIATLEGVSTRTVYRARKALTDSGIDLANPRDLFVAKTFALGNYTYNQAHKRTGVPIPTSRRVYNSLVEQNVITPTAKFVHYTTTPKKKLRMTDEGRAQIIRAFRANPGMAIASVANLTDYSFGACYKIHDKAVLDGTLLTTHRRIKTCVAYEPPLYIGAN